MTALSFQYFRGSSILGRNASVRYFFTSTVASAVALCVVWDSRTRLSKSSHKQSWLSAGVVDDDGPDADHCDSD